MIRESQTLKVKAGSGRLTEKYGLSNVFLVLGHVITDVLVRLTQMSW